MRRRTLVLVIVVALVPLRSFGAALSTPALLDCARVSAVTLLSAHRGGPRPGAPENSIAAMEASIADGAYFLEIDVAETADGALVLMHDRTVDRTTTGTGAVADLSLAELRALRLVDGEGQVLDMAPPTLAEAFAAVGERAVLQLDVKGVEPERLVAAIRAADATDRVLVITYSPRDALAIHGLAPELVLSVGLDSVAALSELEDAGLGSDRVVAWLGLGDGAPALDAGLAARGVETSYGDFRGEREPGHDYAAHAAAGAEILAVDDVRAAARALDARVRLHALAEACADG